MPIVSLLNTRKGSQGKTYIDFEYDFRGKTTTQLTNDGWTLGSGYACDSEGLYVSNNWNAYCKHDISSIKNAKIITLESTYKTSTGYGHSAFVQNDDETSANFGLGYNQSSSRPGVENTSHSFTVSLSNVGIVTAKLILDIANGTWSYTLASYSQQGTLSLPGSSYVNNYLGLRANIDSGSPRLQTVNLTAEF